MNSLLQMQVFYEVAMELGAEADLQKTAKKCLSAYLHKLGCLAGTIVRVDLAGGTECVDSVVTLPRSLKNNRIFEEEWSRIRNSVSQVGIEVFLGSLPHAVTTGDTHYYTMELKGFGFLLLLKKGEPLDRGTLHGITRLNLKLAQACLASQYRDELEATVQERTRDLQEANQKLKESLASVKTLSGLLPICAGCKKIRDDQGYWNQIEIYVRNHSQAEFTHSLCPNCIRKYYPDFAGEEDRDPVR